MSISKEELSNLKKLFSLASPAPWTLDEDTLGGQEYFAIMALHPGFSTPREVVQTIVGDPNGRINCQFILEAHRLLPGLFEQIETQQAQIEGLFHFISNQKVHSCDYGNKQLLSEDETDRLAATSKILATFPSEHVAQAQKRDDVVRAAIQLLEYDFENCGTIELLIDKIKAGSSWMSEEMIPFVKAVAAQKGE